MKEKIYEIPVPESKLSAVYAVLGGASTEPHKLHEAEAAEKEGFWTPELIAKLHAEYTNQSVRKLFDLTATGDPVSMKQVTQAAGVEMPTVRAGLAGLTMFLKSRFGANGAQDWPITPFYRGNDLMYRMSPQIAAWWKAAA